jgi:AcrR family transcriptional regulator
VLAVPIRPRSWPTQEQSKPKRRALSLDRIVEAALAIIDAEGMDALSMRRVAQDLDTGPASLYAHIQNKEELLEHVLDRVYAEVPVQRPDPERWQEQLKDYVRQVRAALTRHGDLARAAMAANIPLTPHTMDGAEFFLSLLRAGGVDDRTAAYGADLVALFLIASCVEDSSRRHVSPEQSASYLEHIRGFFESAPPDRYPTIISMAGALTSGSSDERFEFSLDVLISGLARHAGSGDSPARG